MSLYSPKRTGQESRRLGLMLSVLYLSHVVTGSLVTRSKKRICLLYVSQSISTVSDILIGQAIYICIENLVYANYMWMWMITSFLELLISHNKMQLSTTSKRMEF